MQERAYVAKPPDISEMTHTGDGAKLVIVPITRDEEGIASA